MEKLKANESHPTFKKLERVIGLLDNIQLELEWIDGGVRVRDNALGVCFELVDKDDGFAMTSVPPMFEWKMIRDKIPNVNCKCRNCVPPANLDEAQI
jgi:hypothetical protein